MLICAVYVAFHRTWYTTAEGSTMITPGNIEGCDATGP